MKKGFSTLIATLLALTGIAQDSTYNFPVANYNPIKKESSDNNRQNLFFEVRGAYSQTVKKDHLNKVAKLDDIISGYPTNWLTDYVSAEIQTKCNGKIKSAKGPNQILTADQKKLLNSTDLNSSLEIKVKYRTKNSATDAMAIREMTFAVTVVPDTEAEYFGGRKEMDKYINENVINKISLNSTNENFQGKVSFSVNEKGETIDAKIITKSGDSEIDKLLIETINNMPKWKPAQNSNGIKVRQDFEFRVGVSGC